MNDQLIEVRCPFTRVRSNGKQSLCGELIVRVRQGSAGQGFCRQCKRNFEFEIEASRYPRTTVAA